MNTSLQNQLTIGFAEKINPLLSKIQDVQVADVIEKFWKDDVATYLTKIHNITEALKNGSIRQEDTAAKVISLTTDILLKGDGVEETINDKEIMRQLKGVFRIVGAPYALASKAVRHALEKPGGYPGDYELLEFIYNNIPTSEHIGYCADMVFLNDDYARAVRSRKDMMKSIFRKYFAETKNMSLSILNIACGASRDLRELFAEENFSLPAPTHFVLIDKSQEALNFSRSKLTPPPVKSVFTYYNHSVYDYLKDTPHYHELLKGQDIVYSIGLADYIPADALQAQTRFFFDLLNPGGHLIIAHKDSKNFHPLTPDWWADWTFYLRNEQEVVDLFTNCGITDYTITIEREKETNIIFFIDIKKK